LGDDIFAIIDSFAFSGKAFWQYGVRPTMVNSAILRFGGLMVTLVLGRSDIVRLPFEDSMRR
jgi:hypothetical protein